MNSTNRVVNRLILALAGVVLLAVGGAVVVATVWSPAADAWSRGASAAQEWLVRAAAQTAVPGSTASGLAFGVIVVAVLLAAILVWVLTRIGGRRSRTVLRSSGVRNPLGRITVTEGFVSDAVKNALADRDDVLSASVTANEVRRQPVLHVSVTPRKNADPRALVDHVDTLLANLAKITGEDTAAYISVHTSLRARLAHDQRRLS